jgi:hypothetical protein
MERKIIRNQSKILFPSKKLNGITKRLKKTNKTCTVWTFTNMNITEHPTLKKDYKSYPNQNTNS